MSQPDLSRLPSAEAAAPLSGQYVPRGRRCSARQGLVWLGGGWAAFRRNPGGWIQILLTVGLLWFVLSLIPLISVAVLPILNGGLMIACERQQRTGRLKLSDAFAGFGNRLAPLMLLGVLSLAGVILSLLPLATVIGFSAASGLLSGKPDPEHLTALQEGFGVSIALLLAASLLLYSALWFAPALVVLQKLGPLEALKTSFLACWRNVGAGLVYFLAATALMIAGVIPVGLGLLVVIPMLIASIHASYRDIFFTP